MQDSLIEISTLPNERFRKKEDKSRRRAHIVYKTYIDITLFITRYKDSRKICFTVPTTLLLLRTYSYTPCPTSVRSGCDLRSDVITSPSLAPCLVSPSIIVCTLVSSASNCSLVRNDSLTCSKHDTSYYLE